MPKFVFRISIICLAAGALLAGTAFAQEWEYRVVPGDTLWDVSAKFLASPEQTPRLQEYNGIEDPVNLRPGSTVRVPVAWLRVSPAPAEIIEVSGTVRVRAAESEPEIDAAAGRLLWAGSVLETGENAGATVGFADGSQLLVAAGTRIIFDTVSTYSGTGMIDTRMRLLQGRVESRVQPAAGPASRFTIDTPPATSTVRGTELRVATSEAGRRTTAEVPVGSVEVESGERRIELPEGYGVTIVEEQPPIELRPLLPEPRVEVPDTEPLRIGTEIEWSAVPGAVAYRIQISDPTGSGPVLTDEIVTAPRAALPALPGGRYLLRIRAIDDEGIEGYDAVRPLALHDRPDPPFVIEPKLDDRMNPTRVRFRWTASATASSYRLQMSRNKDFEPLLLDLDVGDRTSLRSPDVLDDGVYFWRVASRDGDGREGAFCDAQRFEIRTGPAGPARVEQESRSLVRWRQGPPGHRYHVEVSRGDDFQNLIGEYEVEEPSMNLDELPEQFYLRIREIDPDGYAGPFGPAQWVDRTQSCPHCRIGAYGLILLTILLL